MPIRVVPAIRAFKLLFANKASAIDATDFYTYGWKEWTELPNIDGCKTVSTVNSEVMIPEIIVLLSYDKIYKKSLRLTKKNIFLRDGYKCQYTGKEVSQINADIDHVLPRSKGGKNTWDNMVVCSKSINRKKGDKTPEEAGLKLIKKPKKPTESNILIDPRVKMPDSWKKFIKNKAV
jgi:5-methylcytosine-specific restriction endonuclease McrA